MTVEEIAESTDDMKSEIAYRVRDPDGVGPMATETP
jgi:hypothetical protein